MTEQHVLIVDDEPKYLRLINFNLKSDGYGTSCVATGEEAVAVAAARHIDLVVLDIMLPGIDGFEVCTRIREFSNVPIIMLTARGHDEDKVKGLRLGADDYVTKPFSAQELTARVAAVLRRSLVSDLGGAPPIKEIGRLKIDFAERRVTAGRAEVSLTPTEYRLLSQLALNAGKVVVQDDLIEQVWGPGYDSDVLRVTVRRLRQKLERDPGDPELVRNVPGVGYVLGGSR